MENSPARRVPSHGTHLFATTYAIDFVADPKSGNGYDSFTWTVSITLKTPNGREIGFDSVEDYAGPPAPPGKPLSPREKLAQVLLMSAEFAFAD